MHLDAEDLVKASYLGGRLYFLVAAELIRAFADGVVLSHIVGETPELPFVLDIIDGCVGDDVHVPLGYSPPCELLAMHG